MYDFFLFHIEMEGKCGWIIVGGRGGGAKGMLAPLSNYWGGPGPPVPPSSYACESYGADMICDGQTDEQL